MAAICHLANIGLPRVMSLDRQLDDMWATSGHNMLIDIVLRLLSVHVVLMSIRDGWWSCEYGHQMYTIFVSKVR